MYCIVNIYNEPVNDVRFATLAEAEEQCAKEWADGYEAYTAYQFGKFFIDPKRPR